MSSKLKTIQKNFDSLSSWEDRYLYILELGDQLPKFENQLKTNLNKIANCQSRTWIVTSYNQQSKKFSFIGDSDSKLVKGLIYLVFTTYQAILNQANQNHDGNNYYNYVIHTFEKLGLIENLSSIRQNGLNQIITKINTDINQQLNLL